MAGTQFDFSSSGIGADLAKTTEELLEKLLHSGQPASESLDIRPEQLEGLYTEAYHLYQSGKYMEALPLFRFLIMMNQREFRYIFGLAACFHLLKDYDNAIKVYTVCSALHPDDPTSLCHTADCFKQLKDPLSAMIALQGAITRAGSNNEFASLRERAVMSLERLKKEHPDT